MDRSMHLLRVESPQPGAVFRITDGASSRVGTGMYQLELNLPPGLYTVSAMLGHSIESKQVILDCDKTVRMGLSSKPSFGDRTFALAPEVMAKLGPGGFDDPETTAIFALCGPWRDVDAVIDQRITLDLDGRAIAAADKGIVKDPSAGIWSWQLFRVGAEAPGVPGVLTATRSVDGMQHSHAVPRFENWVVWAAYPPPKESAADGADLPSAHYVRLRLTRPGSVPIAWLQGLSDQIFTALAGRSALPFSEPVLDILFADEADPLLAMAAAHVASLSLAWVGLLEALPQDAAPSGAVTSRVDESKTAGRPNQCIAPEVLRRRVKAWLELDRAGRVVDCPDMVAVRFLFGLVDRIDLRKPPVLLRSLDVLIKATHAHSSSAVDRGPTLEDSAWLTRFQVSDTFAYLQWETDSDSTELRFEQIKQWFDLARTIEESARTVRATISAAKSEVGVRDLPAASAARTMYAPADENPFEAFVKLNAQALRLPASTIGSLASQLEKSCSKGK